MNRDMAFVIGVIVIIAVAAVVVTPALFPPKTSMTVTFYDADGNVVWLQRSNPGLFEFDFVTEAGADVTYAAVTVDYVVSGHEDGNTINTKCTFYVEAIPRAYGASPVGDATHVCRVKTTSTGTFTHDFYFDDFMTVTEAGKSVGWQINVLATLECLEYLPGTTTLVDTAIPWTDTLGFKLDWDEGAAFTIVGSDFGFGAG